MKAEKNDKIPHEIRKFIISKFKFKKILEESLERKINSVKIQKEGVEISFSNSVVEKIVGEKYDKRIESLKPDEEEVEIIISSENAVESN